MWGKIIRSFFESNNLNLILLNRDPCDSVKKLFLLKAKLKTGSLLSIEHKMKPAHVLDL